MRETRPHVRFACIQDSGRSRMADGLRDVPGPNRAMVFHAVRDRIATPVTERVAEAIPQSPAREERHG